MMHKEIIISGKKLAYNVCGEGKPVMLVHGFGEMADVWQNQIDRLQQQFRLIIPHLPGSGKSDLQEDMSMEGMAASLKAIADKEQLAAFILVGHSMGGYITLAFAEKYPGSLRAFGLFHSSAFPDSEEKKATRRKGIAFMREHGAFAFLKNTSPNLFSPMSKDEKPELIDGFISGLSNFSVPTLVSYYESMMQRPDRVAVLKKTSLPVLFVMGEFDNAVPLEDGLKLCHLPENAYIDILSRSGHMGMLEEIDKTNKLLEQFLTEV